jgi:hypothetical protein
MQEVEVEVMELAEHNMQEAQEVEVKEGIIPLQQQMELPEQPTQVEAEAEVATGGLQGQVEQEALVL